MCKDQLCVKHAKFLMSHIYVAVTGRKRTLFHCKWANSISYISRMLY